MLTSSKSNQLSPLHCLRLELFIRNLARQKLHQVPSLSKLEISSISDKFPGSVARRYVQDVWLLQTLPFLDVNSEKLEWQRENSFRSKLALRWGPGPWPRGANPLWKNVLDIVKKFTPFQKTLLPPWCPKLVTCLLRPKFRKPYQDFWLRKNLSFIQCCGTMSRCKVLYGLPTNMFPYGRTELQHSRLASFQ